MIYRNFTTLAHHSNGFDYRIWYDTPNFKLFCGFSGRSAVRNRNITFLYALDINTLQDEAFYVLNVDSHFKQNTPHNHYVGLHQTVK
jgi:hypothetical protein